MPTNENLKEYHYEARDSKGRFIEGKTRAENPRVVTQHLASKGFILLEINEKNALQRDLRFGVKRVKPKTVAQFVRQFATLNEAAIPISRSLDLLRDQEKHPTLKAVLGTIREDINTGSTLGAAIAKHPTVFTPLTSSMIKAGEAGGFLTETLVTVAENLEGDVKLRAKIKSAMTYPVTVLVFAGILVGIMLTFIVPVFAEMFTTFGSELPAPTQVLISMADVLKVGGIPIAIAIGVAMWWWNKNKHRMHIRRAVDPLKLKIPIFGKLIQKIAIARFAQNFGALLSAGLPVMQVLDIVGSTSGTTVVEDALIEVKKGVSQGELIAPQLAKHPIFPRMLVEMLSIGEDAGEIPQMMGKISKTYNDEVEVMTDSLSSILEPVMLIFLGGVIGGMVIALYLPIFSIMDVVAG